MLGNRRDQEKSGMESYNLALGMMEAKKPVVKSLMLDSSCEDITLYEIHQPCRTVRAVRHVETYMALHDEGGGRKIFDVKFGT